MQPIASRRSGAWAATTAGAACVVVLLLVCAFFRGTHRAPSSPRRQGRIFPTTIAAAATAAAAAAAAAARTAIAISPCPPSLPSPPSLPLRPSPTPPLRLMSGRQSAMVIALKKPKLAPAMMPSMRTTVDPAATARGAIGQQKARRS